MPILSTDLPKHLLISCSPFLANPCRRQDQHSVSKGVKTVLLSDRLLV
jgi:hypothetical protein